MRPPIFVRELTEEERVQLGAGPRSGLAFVLRRSQIVLASSQGERAPGIVHAKRRIFELDRTLSVHELAERICATFGCIHENHLAIASV